MSLNVFISYAKEDEVIAEKYYEWLEKSGFTPWMDIKKLIAGQNWEFEIDKALNNANVVILLLSSSSVGKRGFVRREFNEAMNKLKYRQQDDIYIIPIIIEECNVPDDISRRLQFIRNIDGNSFNSIRESLLIAAKQQSIAITIGTSNGPYLIKSNEIQESWDDNLGHNIDITYPSFVSDSKPEVASELSAYFLGNAIKILSELRQEKLEKIILTEEELNSNIKNEYSESFDIAFVSNNIISIYMTLYYYFSGAAHGQIAFSTFNFDTSRNSIIRIRLEDLFEPRTSYLEIISEYTIKQLRKEYWEKTGEEVDEHTMNWFKEGASAHDGNFENFLITDTGLRFLFPPYQVGPYALGAWNVEVPYFELRHILRSDGPYSHIMNK